MALTFSRGTFKLQPNKADQEKLREHHWLIGRNMKRLRQQAGLILEDMEEKGFNLRYYKDIEAGRGNPTVQFLFRVAEVFGVPLSDLLEKEEPRGMRRDQPLSAFFQATKT